ncbi:phosphotransferase [Nonomuraea typhae]|uniref:phosphotransferase n=1 Tax=Nonomuraea typhae TaxID=2603600 RepID=UPI0015E1E051|nr:phosphotransferase [Nonomuraea typhae]
MQAGNLIASGRDCHILCAGAGKVIRRARDGRSLEREASIMRHARRHGFPAPEVYDADGPDILMERVDGVSIADDARAHPDRLLEYGRLLAGLLGRLGTVRAPGWLPAADGCPGNRLLHLDLHPANVLLTADGPQVIDWADAARGAAAADVAATWLVLAAAPLDPALEPMRAGMIDAFLERVDAESARRYLPALARRRRDHKHTGDEERARIDAILAA